MIAVQLCFSLAFSAFLVHAIRLFIRASSYYSFAYHHGCTSLKTLNVGLTSRISHKLSLAREKYGDLFNDYYARKFITYGATHAIVDAWQIPKVIHTVEPANLRQVLVTSASDWGVANGQRNSLYPLVQRGVLTTSGSEWSHNRKHLARHVNGAQSRDPRAGEGDVRKLFEAIGTSKSGEWTQVADVSDLIRRMALDMATNFFFGISAKSQQSGIQKRAQLTEMRNATQGRNDRSMNLVEDFNNAFDEVRDFVTWRAALGSKYWLADGPKYRTACAKVENFADRLIEEVAARAAQADDTSTTACLVRKLLDTYQDPVLLRGIVVELSIAGQNMSGTSLQWAFAELCTHAKTYAALRHEILEKFGNEEAHDVRPMTWEHLKTCDLLQRIIAETLRLHPVVPTIAKTALRDTILPTGGGPDGHAPIAVPEGATFNCNLYLMQRRVEDWGRDACEWKPERWIGRKAGPEYAPFSAGPRNCIGRQMALTEMSYVLARTAQHFEAVRAADNSDNLLQQYRGILIPKLGVKLQFKSPSGFSASYK